MLLALLFGAGAAMPDDSYRSKYGSILVTSGSQSDHTTGFWFTIGYQQAGRGQDDAQWDGLRQSHWAG